MKVHTARLEIATHGKGTTDITDAIQNIVAESGIRNGIVTVFVRHTSASLVIYENADSSARVDLHKFFERLVPETTPWFVHNLEGADDMPAHIRMALTRTSESVPIVDGRLDLGTWQGIFLFEHRNTPHVREIQVTLLGQ